MPPTNGVRVKLGGKNRTLRMTHRAMDRLETDTGLATPQVLTRANLGHVRYMISFLWSLLLHEDPDLERDTVIDWLDDLTEEESEDLTQKLGEAFSDQKSEAEEGAEGNVEAASTA